MLSANPDLSRYTVPNVDRALTMLERLAEVPPGLTLSELSGELGLPLNSLYRIAKTLQQRGYLEQDERGGGYRLTSKWLRFGIATAAGEASLVESALPVMRRLRDATGETAAVGIVAQDEGVVLEQVPGTYHFRFVIDPGTRFHLHCAAPGKAIMAHLPRAEREGILGRIDLPRFTERTLVTAEALAAELEEVRERGYAVDHGEEVEGQHCLGSAILDGRGYPVAAVWITGPAFRLPVESFSRLGEIFAEGAREIAERMGIGATGAARKMA